MDEQTHRSRRMRASAGSSNDDVTVRRPGVARVVEPELVVPEEGVHEMSEMARAPVIEPVPPIPQVFAPLSGAVLGPNTLPDAEERLRQVLRSAGASGAAGAAADSVGEEAAPVADVPPGAASSGVDVPPERPRMVNEGDQEGAAPEVDVHFGAASVGW